MITDNIGIPDRWLKYVDTHRDVEYNFSLVKRLIDYNNDYSRRDATKEICKLIADYINNKQVKPTRKEIKSLDDFSGFNLNLIKKNCNPPLEEVLDNFDEKVGNKIEISQKETKEDVEEIHFPSGTIKSNNSNDDQFENKRLQLPDKKTLDAGIEQISEELWIDKKVILQIITNLCAGRHILLGGPIGTGKSALAEKIPKVFWNYETELVTATFEWGASDVVGGYKPRADREGFEMIDGCVTRTVKDSNKLKNKGKWLIIDEFNRADIDKAMGQLFSSLVNGKIQSNEEQIEIPPNYRIIGTLNTSDKHYLHHLSSALLRRFAYIVVNHPIDENPEIEFGYALRNAFDKTEFSKEDVDRLFKIEDDKDIVFSKPMFEDLFKHAFNIFQYVRNEKAIGTAVIEAMFQTMITRLLLRNEGENIANGSEALDYALVSNIMPQLWNTNNTFLECLKAFCTDDIGKFFIEKFKEIKKQQVPNFQKYAKEMRNFQKMYVGMITEKNYFPTGDLEKMRESDKKGVWDIIKDFEDGIKFEDVEKIETFKKIIQKSSTRNYNLEFFKRTLDEEIRKSDFETY